MTTVVRGRLSEAGDGPSAHAGVRTRIGWGVFTLVLLAAAAVILASMETDLGGDPRVTNPNPGPGSLPPFLGLDDVPSMANVAPAVGSAVLLGTFLFLSVRRRRLHPGVILVLAITFMGVLDPIANWATFTVFDPRIGHFPLDWPWMRFAPLLEPSFSFLGGYATYYFTVSLGLYWLYHHVVMPRMRAGSWIDRHRLLSLSLFCFVVSIPIDIVMLFGWLRFGIVSFLEGVGPVLTWGGVQLSLGMVLYDSWPFLFIPMLCQRDEDGRSVVLARLARRLPHWSSSPRDSSARQLVAGTALMIAVGLVPFSVFSVLRVTHQFRPTYDEFPFPAAKVYDPYGDLREAGKAGPFYP